MVNNMTDLTAQEAAWQTRDHLDDPVIGELRNRFGPDAFTVQATRTGVPVVWVKREQLLEVVDFLKKLPKPYVMLFDLHGMDERLRTHRQGLPAADFSVFYHLISIDRNTDIMLKVALSENDMHLPTITKLFPNANWYERETWEMFGMTFDGHPHLTRIMMPQTWTGHPLRKDYPARATEFDPFELTKAKQDLEMEALTFKPEDWGMKRGTENEDFMFLNLGPNHPSAHGAFRINHHGRPLVAVTQAAGRQQSKASIERGLARLDIELLLNRSLNALITGDVADNAVTIADHMAANRLTEDLAVERGYAFYVTCRNTQHFCDLVDRPIRHPATLFLYDFQRFNGRRTRVFVVVHLVLNGGTFCFTQLKSLGLWLLILVHN